jgi:hypothetical protein
MQVSLTMTLNNPNPVWHNKRLTMPMPMLKLTCAEKGQFAFAIARYLSKNDSASL